MGIFVFRYKVFPRGGKSYRREFVDIQQKICRKGGTALCEKQMFFQKLQLFHENHRKKADKKEDIISALGEDFLIFSLFVGFSPEGKRLCINLV